MTDRTDERTPNSEPPRHLPRHLYLITREEIYEVRIIPPDCEGPTDTVICKTCSPVQAILSWQQNLQAGQKTYIFNIETQKGYYPPTELPPDFSRWRWEWV